MDHERWSEAQERTTVAVDGHELDLAYRDAGSGEPVIFLHGIPTWSFLWRQVAPRLEDQFRTIVPDLMGYGNSDRREGFDRSIRAQEQVLAGLVEELELDRFHVVSHDIGGGVALRYGAHTDGRIDRLVCSNATCYGSWPVDYIVDLGLPRTTEMNPEEFRDELNGAFLGGLEREEPDPEWTAGIEAPWLRLEGQRAFARAAVATNTNHTTEIDYGEIDAELLCLWGAADAEQPIEDGERLIEDIGGECVGLEDAGHWVMEDRPDAYTEHVEGFLTEG
ncbi:alpha/beta hydrolase [Halobacteriales archaeon QS_3_64_16]|nr:MAG: alpha/beta hydrolase [Halobacteriales archaeon QS_3_64_16]